MLQSYIDSWVEELERVVSAFETAVDEVEEAMDSVDQDARQLDSAIESAQQVAALVKAVNAALDDAIDAAQVVVSNEQVGLSVDNCEASTLIDQLRAPANRAPARDAPTIHEMLDVVGVPIIDSSLEPLPGGTIIMQGKYRIVQVLHRRPRLHLYLAERLNDQSQSFVAIRELILASLSPGMNKQVERAAFEEFVAPMLFGAPHLPGVGDRICIENERHYIVMQIRPVRGKHPAIAVSLADLLLHQPRWPAWLDVEMVREWGIQLCRIVARLHRMGVTLGDLHPATILVDPQCAAAWSPVLLVSWPPPSQFWSNSSSNDRSLQQPSTHIFPIAAGSTDNAFVAPEIFHCEYDQRSDVYSLGAILYLLLTRYAPVVAPQRIRAGQNKASHENQGQRDLGEGEGRLGSEGIELIPPHLFNRHISLTLEQVVVRALSINADDRYSSVAALLEALESIVDCQA